MNRQLEAENENTNGNQPKRIEKTTVQNAVPDSTSAPSPASLQPCHTCDLYAYMFLNEEEKGVMPKMSRNRTKVFNWMMKQRVCKGNEDLVQMARLYWDTVLTKSNVKMSLMTTAAACLKLIQRTYYPAFKDQRLLTSASKEYECKLMETFGEFIQYKLGNHSKPVIPQVFIRYLSSCCADRDDINSQQKIEQAATFICMIGMMVDKKLCHEYPSVIGAAAVMNAVALLGKQQAMQRLGVDKIYRAAHCKSTNLSIIRKRQRQAMLSYIILRKQYPSPWQNYNRPFFVVQRMYRSLKGRRY